ncbi:MAG: hypothetical protein WC889_16555 [Myxococcota bacterium]|jgi:hypothetical protein
MQRRLNEDFLDLLRLFSGGGVKYLLVGGYALAVHGRPRATGDMDLWVEPSAGNAGAVYRALAGFGAPLQGITADDLSLPGVVFQIGLSPRRIDVITSIDGVTFEGAWPNRVAVELDGVTVNVIGRSDLLKNKRSTGRLQDLADVEMLEKQG